MNKPSIMADHFRQVRFMVLLFLAIVSLVLIGLSLYLSHSYLPVSFVLLGIVAVGVLVVFIVRPFYALLVFLITIPFSYQVEIGTMGTILKPLGFILILCSIPTLLLKRKTFLVHIRNTGLWMLGLLLAAFLSLFSFIAYETSLLGFIFIIGDCLFYLLCVVLIDSMEKIKWALGVLVASFAVSSVIALSQKILFNEFRIEGTFTDPNYFALGVLPLIFIVLYVFWFCKWSWQRILSGLLFLLFIVTVPLTLSRSGLISLLLVFVVTFIKMKKVKYLFLIMGVVILAALVVLPPWMLEGLKWQSLTSGSRILSVQLRQSTLVSGWKMFCAHPILGVGVDNFRYVFYSFSSTFPRILKMFAHNTYLEFLTGMGIVGFIPFIGILISSLLNLQKARKKFSEGGNRMGRYLSEGIQMGFLAYLVDIFFLTAHHDKLFWFLIALSTAMIRIASQVPQPRQPPVC